MYKKGSKAEALNDLLFTKEEIKGMPSACRIDARRYNEYIQCARNIEVWIRNYKETDQKSS